MHLVMSLSTELVETKFVAEHVSKQQYHSNFFDSNLTNMKKTWKGITVIPVHAASRNEHVSIIFRVNCPEASFFTIKFFIFKFTSRVSENCFFKLKRSEL